MPGTPRLTKQAIQLLSDYGEAPETVAAEAICWELAALREAVAATNLRWSEHVPEPAISEATRCALAYKQAAEDCWQIAAWLSLSQTATMAEVQKRIVWLTDERAALTRFLRAKAARIADRGIGAWSPIVEEWICEIESGEHRKEDRT